MLHPPQQKHADMNRCVTHYLCCSPPVMMRGLEKNHFITMKLAVLLLVCASPLVQSYKTGLVTASCEDMTPHHSSLSQTGPSPFTVITTQSSYKLGEDIKVELQAPSTPFTGFLLEAREVGGRTPVGSFALKAGAAQLLNCNQKPNSAVSHTSDSTKNNIQVTWRSDASGDMKAIQFHATFVQNYRTFWVNVTSPVLTFNNRAARSTNPLSASSSTSTPTPTSKNEISSAGCGVTKVCFSQPSNCDPAVSAGCYFMSAMMLPSGEAVRYEMSGRFEGYIAFGFSDDQKMGNDDIYICGMNSNGLVEVQHAFSTGRTAPQILPLGSVSNITASMQNGVISCTFTSANTISTTRTSGFNQTYYLLFVHGPTSNGRIQYHSGDFISPNKIDISKALAVSDAGLPDIMKAHGSLMLIAWMTTGALGMMVARYLKGIAKGQKLCNKDIWFVVHVGLMCLTVAATIIAFILAFSHAKDWSGGAHPVLGCLVMILSFIQPIAALLRCTPQHKMRFVFNWLHALNAVVIKVLAVAAIFTGLKWIDRTDGWLMKVMGGFIGWEALFYILLEVHSWKVKRTGSASIQGESSAVRRDVLLVALFFLGNFCFLVALLVGIGKS